MSRLRRKQRDTAGAGQVGAGQVGASWPPFDPADWYYVAESRLIDPQMQPFRRPPLTTKVSHWDYGGKYPWPAALASPSTEFTRTMLWKRELK